MDHERTRVRVPFALFDHDAERVQRVDHHRRVVGAQHIDEPRGPVGQRGEQQRADRDALRARQRDGAAHPCRRLQVDGGSP